MDSFFYLIVFIFGAIIGSFLNVVILRLGTGRDIGGRSGCPHCNKQLSWYELVPILSFLFLQGRCGGCRAKISSQYAIVEILTGLIFMLIAMRYEMLLALGSVPLFLIFSAFAWLVASILIVIAVYDYRHMIIPDKFVWTLVLLGALQHLLIFLLYGWDMKSLLDLVAGPLFFSFFATLWLMSKGAWIGFGDAKLALALGLILGFSRGLTGLLLSFWIGAVIGLILVGLSKIERLQKHFGMRSEIPFGPFMILGAALSYFLNLDLVWVSSLFI